jgi:hypothetical protein
MSSSPNTHSCPECGATYSALDDSCAARFETLLALDHSRQEPWGSRHGEAFAAYALQHPAMHAASLDRAWLVLQQICVKGMAPDRVFGALVAARGKMPPGWEVPARAARPVRAPAITIADLGDFDAATYAGRLDEWCRAALAAWGAAVA